MREETREQLLGPIDEEIAYHEGELESLNRMRVAIMGEEPTLVKPRQRRNAAKRGRPRKPVAKTRARNKKAKRGRPTNAQAENQASE